MVRKSNVSLNEIHFTIVIRNSTFQNRARPVVQNRIKRSRFHDNTLLKENRRHTSFRTILLRIAGGNTFFASKKL